MSNDPMDLVLLLECLNDVEANAMKGVLEQNGLFVSIESENLGTLMPHLQHLLPPRLMVRRSEFERARALINATSNSTVPSGTIQGGVCAVHEREASSVCSRCGSFLCEQCSALGDPPVCESCQLIEKVPDRNRSPLRVEAILIIAFFVLALVGFLLSRGTGLLW